MSLIINQMGKILVIAEQSEVIRKGLTQIIGSFNMFDRIHEISCNSSLESGIIKMNPDVLIINPSLIHPGGPEWLAGFKDGKIKVAAIVYSLFDYELTDLFDQVIHVDDNRLKIKNKLGKLITGPFDRKMPNNDTTLSLREKDVVRLLARGLSNKEISEKLFISPHTTITHRKNITRKLNIKSVAGLIVYAIINEIVTVDEMQGD
jgi:two-component system, NarL family, response regulator NreC